jgi:octanoyl-[GcvH]:protein N-octanoyltransferase
MSSPGLIGTGGARSPAVQLLREGFTSPPERDTAVSHALLRLVAVGAEPETLRIHRPGRVVAFGPLDRLAPGFGEAIEAASAHGFGSVLRLAGGRAAVFHEDTVAFAWVVPEPSPRAGITARFGAMADLVEQALRSLGVDARIGDVPGEYCPGEYSVNAGGRVKLAGIGQRLIAGAAHVGGVLVVDGANEIRQVLDPVNRALGVEWDPRKVGSVHEEARDVGWDDVAGALVGAFANSRAIEEGSVSPTVLDLARELEPRHVARPRA